MRPLPHPYENFGSTKLFTSWRSTDSRLKTCLTWKTGIYPLEIDPKLAWAEKNLRHNPLEINTASRDQLLRVPGLGPKGVNTLLNARCQKTLTSLNQLKLLGIHIQRAKPFILLNGRSPARQITLF